MKIYSQEPRVMSSSITYLFICLCLYFDVQSVLSLHRIVDCASITVTVLMIVILQIRSGKWRCLTDDELLSLVFHFLNNSLMRRWFFRDLIWNENELSKHSLSISIRVLVLIPKSLLTSICQQFEMLTNYLCHLFLIKIVFIFDRCFYLQIVNYQLKFFAKSLGKYYTLL